MDKQHNLEPASVPVPGAAPVPDKKNGRFRNFCVRHDFKPGFVRLIVILLIGLLIFSVYSGISTATVIRSKTTDLGFRNIGELATQAGYYTNVQVISGSREIFGLSIPLTEKKYIFGYDGVIKAGIDFADVSVSVDELSHTVTVSMPEVKVLSNEIDEDSFEIYDENKNIFNTLKVSEINTSLKALKEESEEKAVSNGLLDNAKRNAETLVTGFLAGTFDLTVYNIVFNWN